MYCLSPPMSEPPEGMYNNKKNTRIITKRCCIPGVLKSARLKDFWIHRPVFGQTATHLRTFLLFVQSYVTVCTVGGETITVRRAKPAAKTVRLSLCSLLSTVVKE